MLKSHAGLDLALASKGKSTPLARMVCCRSMAHADDTSHRTPNTCHHPSVLQRLHLGVLYPHPPRSRTHSVQTHKTHLSSPIGEFFFAQFCKIICTYQKNVVPLQRKLCGEKIAITLRNCIIVLKSNVYVNKESSEKSIFNSRI